MGIDKGIGVEVLLEFCMSDGIILELYILDRISKQLHVDNEGILFTHCLVQNPLGLLLPFQMANFPFSTCPFCQDPTK